MAEVSARVTKVEYARVLVGLIIECQVVVLGRAIKLLYLLDLGPLFNPHLKPKRLLC